jgi:hypothetical protein
MRQDHAKLDVLGFVRARDTLIWIRTTEEVRVENALLDVAASIDPPMDVRFWDCADGLQDASRRVTDATMADPLKALEAVAKNPERAIYVFRDLHDFTSDPYVARTVRSLGRALQATAATLVVLSPSSENIPEGMKVYDWPRPDRDEMTKILDDLLSAVDPDKFEIPDEAGREAAVDAALGLTAVDAESAFSASLVRRGAIDRELVAAEKKRVIAQSSVLTWYDPDPRGLDAIGGLDRLKSWLLARKDDLTAEAREYGMPAPKGVFLLGPPGTGKSLTAKTVATAWELPLVAWDWGAGKSKYVGESEATIREAWDTVKSVAPVVVWMDEIDKAMAGSEGPQGDGGVSSDALGKFLQWLQDDSNGVFVVATANDVRGLPDALLRKGRFDELFFVDLPTATERRAIFAACLRGFRRDPDVVLKDEATVDALIEATDGFSGAEINALIPEAMHTAYPDGRREITAADLLEAAGRTVPTSKTGSKVAELRDWAKARTVPASSPEAASDGPARRLL